MNDVRTVWVVVAYYCYGDDTRIDSAWTTAEAAEQRAFALRPERTIGKRNDSGAYVEAVEISE